MRIVIAKDYTDMSAKAARMVAGQLYLKPDSVLGLATGSTPLSMYQELIKIHHEISLDFSEVITFNLDEYLGLTPEDANSYHFYMFHNFFNHINILRNNIYIPNGLAQDISKECQDYDRKIQECGGIDLQVLGIGVNGHIGFNEPDINFEAITHKVKLDEETINVNARFFASIEAVPRYAISMGIKTIMNARKILLLANGVNKAEALYRTINKGITPDTPASILQLHPDVTIIAEAGAAKLLERTDI